MKVTHYFLFTGTSLCVLFANKVCELAKYQTTHTKRLDENKNKVIYTKYRQNNRKYDAIAWASFLSLALANFIGLSSHFTPSHVMKMMKIIYGEVIPMRSLWGGFELYYSTGQYDALCFLHILASLDVPLRKLSTICRNFTAASKRNVWNRWRKSTLNWK